MRLYPNQITALEYILERVTKEGFVLDREIKAQMEQNKRWGARDRRNFYQAAYDIIRHYELLSFMAQNSERSIIGTYIQSLYDMAIDFERIDTEYPEMEFHIRYSIPGEVLNLFRDQDVHCIDNLKAMQRAGAIFLRINTSLISLQKFSGLLDAAEIDHQIIDKIQYDELEIGLSAIQLSQTTQRHAEFFRSIDSYFEIQDIGSQILTECIDLSGAKIIIESCAGQGGKTTHMMNKAAEWNPMIISFDKEAKKLEHLIRRIAKWKNHKVVVEQAKEKEIKKYEGLADILYMDMPCTGSGVLKRQADIKYRLSKEDLMTKISLQRELFLKFDGCLKSGGTLAYTTCSLFRSENEEQMEWISSNGYSIQFQKRFEPYRYAGDGFFIGILKKN